MMVIDYNGSGVWSVDDVLARYALYVQKYGISTPLDLRPVIHAEDQKQWIYPVMDRVIEGIESGDLACAEIGVEFIEEDASFAFGRILKSNTARALRRNPLTNELKERIRKRVVGMLAGGYLPREYRQYAKLARKIGLREWLSEIKERIPIDNPWAQRYYKYFAEHASH
jgi:hypothetical protein